MGVGALSCSPPDVVCARVNLERAKEMMNRIREDCDNCGEVTAFLFVCLFQFRNFLLFLFEQEFPYEEQFGLVETHLQMLDGNGEASNDQIVRATMDDEDEEWSSCDSSDDDMQT